MAYQGDPNFLERQVEFVIQAVLMARCMWGGPLIMQVPDEQKTGADGYARKVYPLFMQFKRSSWIKSGYGGSAIPVLKDRKSLKAKGQDWALYFKVHPMGQKAKDFQHNILLKLDSKLTKTTGRAQGRAVYVAPLFIHKGPYIRAAVRACIVASIKAGLNPLAGLFPKGLMTVFNFGSVGKIPLIDNHVCFPPTSLITSPDHFYSYSRKGEDIVFHSPVRQGEGRSSLGTWLDHHFSQMRDGEGFYDVDELAHIFRDFLREHEDVFPVGEDDVEAEPLARVATILREVYAIEFVTFRTRTR